MKADGKTERKKKAKAGDDSRTFGKVKRERYLELLREGSRRGAAARSLGFHPDTPRQYANRHPGFGDEIERAEMEAHEIVEDALFQAASSGNVTACIFYLANRSPDRWRDVRHIQHEGGDRPIQHSVGVSSLSDEELIERARSLIGATGATGARSDSGGAGEEAGSRPGDDH